MHGCSDLEIISLGLGGRKLELRGAGDAVERGSLPEDPDSQCAVCHEEGCDEPGPYLMKRSEEGDDRRNSLEMAIFRVRLEAISWCCEYKESNMFQPQDKGTVRVALSTGTTDRRRWTRRCIPHSLLDPSGGTKEMRSKEVSWGTVNRVVKLD